MIRVAVVPHAYERPRFTKGRTYNSRAYEEWRNDAAWLIRAITGPSQPQEGPVAVHLEFAPRELIVALTEAPGRPKGLRGDLDNYVKAALDVMCQAGLIVDDRQVTSLTADFREA